MSFTRTLAFKVTAIAGSLILPIVIIDTVLFLVFDIKPVAYKPDRFFQFSPLTGHFHKPLADGNWYRYPDGTKFHVTINSFGFADSERSPKSARPRIALVGDSTTEFWEAEEKYRPQNLLEGLLAGRFEVLNLGVRDYGTDQTFLLFKTIGVHFDPQIVIYTFCINDFHDNAKTQSKPYYVIDPAKPGGLDLRGYPVQIRSTVRRTLIERLFENSFTYRRLLSFLDSVSHEPIPLEKHFELRPYKRLYNEQDEQNAVLTMRLVSQLADFVRSQGMRFLLVEGTHRPGFDEMGRAEAIEIYGDLFDFDKVTRLLESHCKAHGIEFLSLARLLRDRGARASDVMHPSDTMHLNNRGAEIYAGAIVEKLTSLGWLPESSFTSEDEGRP